MFVEFIRLRADLQVREYIAEWKCQAYNVKMSLQLDRISVRPRAIQTFTIPPFPKLPTWFVRQFKLEAYEGEVERWRQNAQNEIRTALQSIKSQSSE